jgi:prepilin-type N-terminal cleavage/methylation domain-containing protein
MRWLDQQGDTLVEVTLALAILALVLTGAFTAANKAFLLGQDAKERSQLVSLAQQQAEALQSFRDSHKWAEFVHGRPLATPRIPGLDVSFASGDCDASQAQIQTCFYMERQTLGGVTQWVPKVGTLNESQVGGGLGYVRIIPSPAVSVGGPPAASYDFTIQYGVPARGGGPDLKNSIWLHLTNLDRLRQ